MPRDNDAGTERAWRRVQNVERHSLKLLFADGKVGEIHLRLIRPGGHANRALTVRGIGLGPDAEFLKSALRSLNSLAAQGYWKIAAVAVGDGFNPRENVGAISLAAMLEGSVRELAANHDEHASVAILPDQAGNIQREVLLKRRIDTVELAGRRGWHVLSNPLIGFENGNAFVM